MALSKLGTSMLDVDNLISTIKDKSMNIDRINGYFNSDFEISQIDNKAQFRILNAAALSDKFEEILTALKYKGFNLAIENPRSVEYVAGEGAEGDFFYTPPSTHLRGGDTLLHNAAIHGNIALASFLISNNIDINVQDVSGHTPLANAQFYYQDKFAEMLQERGAHLTKIDFGKFKFLIDKAAKDGKRDVNIAEMLASNGYSANLDDMTIDAAIFSKNRFDSIDFSGSSLKNTKVTVENVSSHYVPDSIAFAELVFRNCDLKNASINQIGVLDHARCFENSNIEELKAHVTLDAIQGAINTKESKIVLIDPNRTFNQSEFSKILDPEKQKLDKRGNCYGICIEYTRYFLKAESKGISLSDANPIDKFRRKMANKTDGFVNRVGIYQSDKKKDIIKTNSPARFSHEGIESIVIPGDSNMVGIGMCASEARGGGHMIVARVVDDHSGARKFVLFDPNYGESPLLTEVQLKEQIIRSYKLGGYDRGIQIHDMAKQVRESGLLNSGQAKYLPEDVLIAAQEAGVRIKQQDVPSPDYHADAFKQGKVRGVTSR